MKFFGRSRKEQFDHYVDFIRDIEKEIFLKHMDEMVELLELAEQGGNRA